MHRSLLFAVLSLSVLFSTLVAAQDASYTFTPIDVPGATNTAAYGINEKGQVVGDFDKLAVSPPERHGFLKDSPTFTTIDVPGAEETAVWGINDKGQIVGWFFDGTKTHGFLATPVR